MSGAIGARGHRNPLDPSVLRDFVAEGLDTSQVRRATVGWEGQSGTDHLELTPEDVAVCVTTLDGTELTARLFASGSVWRLPPIGDECLVIAPEGEFAAVGAPSVLWPLRAPPSNATTTRAVVDVPADGLLLGNGATKGLARKDDPVRVTIPAGTTFDGTIAGEPPTAATFTTTAPVTCDGFIREGSTTVKAQD